MTDSLDVKTKLAQKELKKQSTKALKHILPKNQDEMLEESHRMAIKMITDLKKQLKQKTIVNIIMVTIISITALAVLCLSKIL